MLIINADDLGRSVSETDMALNCYRANRVSSVTAMVFMADSERAAQLALASSVPTGLHLNLTESFTAHTAPNDVRTRLERVANFLNRGKYATLIFNPRLTNDFHYLFRKQVDEFIRLYGQPPSHVDGHQHQHLCTNMIIGDVIPHCYKVRRTFHFWAGEKSIANRVYRKALGGVLSKRHAGTDYFFALEECFEPARMQKILALASRCSVELMTHPANVAERELLMSENFGILLNSVELGDYNKL